MALPNHRPLICLVTDRRRLAPVGPDGRRIAQVVALVRAGAAAGVDLIQVREHDLSGRSLEGLAASCVRAAESTATRIVVNDRFDIALATGAAGVHLRADSAAASRVRAVAPPAFLIGRSVHAAAEAAVSGPVDYLLLGTIFESTSKRPGHETIGVAELARAAAATPRPVLAIGGVTCDRMGEVSRAGAAGVAAIGLFIEAVRSCHDWTEALGALVRSARQTFGGP